LRVLRESENPVEKSIVEIVPMLEDIRSMVQGIGGQSRDSGMSREFLEVLVLCNYRAFEHMHTGNLGAIESYAVYLGRLIDILESRISEENRFYLQKLRDIRNSAISHHEMILEKSRKSEEESEEE